MPVRTDVFPKALIRAVDDWQAGSKDKARKARHLKERTRYLPDAYRRSPKLVFRQVRVNAQLAIGVALDAVPEAISSWRTSEQVARRFRESDQDRSKVMMIFARSPDPDDVILNLEVLYDDPDFLKTVSATALREFVVDLERSGRIEHPSEAPTQPLIYEPRDEPKVRAWFAYAVAPVARPHHLQSSKIVVTRATLSPAVATRKNDARVPDRHADYPRGRRLSKGRARGMITDECEADVGGDEDQRSDGRTIDGGFLCRATPGAACSEVAASKAS